MASYKLAIDMKCAECIYDPGSEGTWRQQVKNCNACLCPLWSVRPLPLGEVHHGITVIPNMVEIRREEYQGSAPP